MTISDLTEKTEPPPLTEREKAELACFHGAFGINHRALARLRWLEAEVAALKAHDPLAEMWRELEAYHEQADRDGHGESWRRMCSERTEAAALAAARAAAWAASAASDAASAAAWAASAAAWAAARAAGYAARSFARDAACAVAEIRRAKEGTR